MSSSETKQIIDTLYRAGLTTLVGLSYSIILKKVTNISSPSFNKMDGTDVIKLIGIIGSADMTIDYAISKGWIPKSIDK